MGLLPFLTPLNIALYLIAITFVAFAAFGIDKALAEGGRQRIAEATLLQFAFFGGSPGAYAGRSAFRHKTRKQPLSSHLHTIGVIHLLGAGAMLGWTLGG